MDTLCEPSRIGGRAVDTATAEVASSRLHPRSWQKQIRANSDIDVPLMPVRCRVESVQLESSIVIVEWVLIKGGNHRSDKRRIAECQLQHLYLNYCIVISHLWNAEIIVLDSLYTLLYTFVYPLSSVGLRLKLTTDFTSTIFRLNTRAFAHRRAAAFKIHFAERARI